jgi:hypothetical protein
MQIYNWWRSRDGVKAYGNHRYKNFETVQNIGAQEFLMKIQEGIRTGDKDALEDYADELTLAVFIEGVGVLVKKDLIDIELVEDLLSQRIIWIWEHGFGQNVDYIRKQANDPTQYDHVEYLYHTLKQRQQTAVIR